MNDEPIRGDIEVGGQPDVVMFAVEPDELLHGVTGGGKTLGLADEFPRIDQAIALDRTLLPMHRARFAERRLIGSYQGATPADWLDEADNTDFGIELTDPWLDQHGDALVAQLADLHNLPRDYVKRLLAGTLVVFIALDWTTYDINRPAARELILDFAGRAAAWSRGYAEARGWLPPDVR